MKIQIDIPKKLNDELKIYKVRNNLDNLKLSVLDILTKYFKEENKNGKK